MAHARPIATTRSATGIPTPRLAVWWILASEVVIFGGLLGAYLMHRIGHPEWAEAASHTQTWIGAVNTFVLLTSSFTAVLAHQAAEKGKGKEAAKLLAFTILGALTFLMIKSYEWTIEIMAGVHDHREYLLVLLLHCSRTACTPCDRGCHHYGIYCGRCLPGP